MPLLSASEIKRRASQLGFAACGLARADAVDSAHAEAFGRWIGEGCNAGMEYMARHRDLRLDPRELHPWTKTVISLALSYRPVIDSLSSSRAQISWYALGRDYHDVMRALMQQMGVEGRICIDTAPILEKYWAMRCGIGFIGRHHQLVIPGQGSAFFLGEILSTHEADSYDQPHAGSCGQCHKCEQACPTGALREDGMLDARLCLSYLTIEHRGEIGIPHPHDGQTYIYGCDRCLRACPHIKGSPCQTHFPINPLLAEMTDKDWHNLTEEQYRAVFKGSAVKRAKIEGLRRNILWTGL